MKIVITLCVLFAILPTAYGERLAVEPVSVDKISFGGPSTKFADVATGEILGETRDLVFGISNTWTFDFGQPIELVGFKNNVLPGSQLETLKFYSDVASEPIAILEVDGTAESDVFVDFDSILAQFVVWESRPIYEPSGDPVGGNGPFSQSIQLELQAPPKVNDLNFFAVPEPTYVGSGLVAGLLMALRFRRR